MASIIFNTAGSIVSGNISNNNINESNASILVGNINTTGMNGVNNSGVVTATLPGGNGISAGSVTIQAQGNIVAGLISANGGNGGGGSSINTSGSSIVTGGNGGNGGNINIQCNGSLTTGTISANGGDGGGGGDAAEANGGNAGNGGNGSKINIATADNITAGAITANGGAGGTGGFGFGGGAGGNGGSAESITISTTNGNVNTTGAINSFGGSGGVSGSSPDAGGNGANGNNGGDIKITAYGSIIISGNINVSGGGGSGGSGGGNGIGGGVGGGVGGIGGTGGSAGIIILNTESATNGLINVSGEVLAASGGSGGNGGASGGYVSFGNGELGFAYYGGGGGGGGSFGMVGLNGNSTGSNVNPNGTGGLGSAGETGPNSTSQNGTNGGNAGSGNASGGQIQISSANIKINGTIGSGIFSSDSVNALGINGSVSINTLINPTYASNADYAFSSNPNLSAVSISTGSIVTAGNIESGQASNSDITINGTAYTASVPAGTFNSSGIISIDESGNSINISSGTKVTPSELIALIQVGLTGKQSLILDGTGAGTGYAIGGDFSINIQNIPSANFTNLDLPSNVAINVNCSNLTYTGSAIINGTMNFSQPSVNINVASTLNMTGNINLNGTGTSIIIADNSITGTGNITDHNSGNLTIQSISGSVNAGSINIGIGNLNIIANQNITNNGLISAGIINLNTSGGNIGSSVSAPLSIATGGLTVNTLNNGATKGNAYINDSFFLVNLMASSVGSNGIFHFTNSGNIFIYGLISAGQDNGLGSINMTATGSSYIQSGDSYYFLQAGSIILNTNGGNIGSAPAAAFSVDTDNLSINSLNQGLVGGSAYINDSAPQVNISNCTLGYNFWLNSNGGILTNGNIIATQSINFTSNNNGNITFDSVVGTTTTNQNITANGTGYITTGQGGVILGKGLSLVADNGEIGFNGNGLITQTSSIVFSANLSVGINNTSANLNIGSSGSAANVYIETSGNLTSSGTITAPVLGLYTFANGTTGIGSANNLMQINAHNVGLESFGKGSSVYTYNSYTGNTIMQASQALDVLKFDNAGPLTIYAQIDQNNVVTPSVISGQIIAIQTLSGYGIYNDSNIKATDFIFLTASQNGYIAQVNNGVLMYAPNIALISGGGAIGAGGQLLLNSAQVAASTQGLNSFVNIYDESNSSGLFGGQSGSYFTFNTNGSVNVLGSIVTGIGTQANGGSINISGNGTMNIGTSTGINLTTNNGSVIVQNNDGNAGLINIAKGDFILGSSTSASLGNVVFNIGAFNQTNTANPYMANMNVKMSGGATVYFGNNGITSMSGGNILYANGRNIIFNTGSLGANAITLGGNVSITADPPVMPESITSNTMVIQNNITNLSNGIFGNNITNTQYMASTQTINVLNNNQAGLSTTTNPNKSDNRNIETSFLNNNDENIEIVENTSLFMPIACSSIVKSSAYNQASKLALKTRKNYNEQENNLTSTTNNKVTITQGSSIIIASCDLTIKLGVIKPVILTLKRGAIVLAIAYGNVTSIYNLHDNNKDSVIVKSPSSKIKLYPGHQVTFAVGDQAPDFAYINQVAKIGYRSLKTYTYKGIIAYESDFSIPSAINALKPLKAIFRSNDRVIKNLANQLLKTSVVVSQSTGYKGIYEQINKPKLVSFR